MLLSGFSQSPVFAQVATDLDHVTSDAVLARLSDTELRALIGKRLAESGGNQVRSDDGFNPAIPLWRFTRTVGAARNRLAELLTVGDRIPEEFASAWQKITAPREGGSFSRLILGMLISLILGLLAERSIRRLADRPERGDSTTLSRNSESLTLTPTLGPRVAKLGVLLAVRLLGIVVFAVVASMVWFLLSGSNAQDRTIFFFYLGATVLVRSASAFVAVFYAPRHPGLRLPVYSDDEARGMHRGLVITVTLSAFAFFTCALFGTMGIRTDAHPLLLLTVGNLYTVALAITVFIYRKAIVRDLTTNASINSVRQIVANVWPWILIGVTVFVWIAVALTALTGGTPLYGAALITTWVVLFYPTIDTALEREARTTSEYGNEVYVAGLRVIRLVACIVIITMTAFAWRINLFGFGGEGSIGQTIAHAALQIAMTLLVAYIIWQTVRIWIDRKIAEEDAALLAEGADPAEMEIGGTGMSRTRTLLPLIKMSMRIALGTIVLMMVLSALGVNIAPVLAGAGVLGLAVGFGSQTLVRDIVSGGFFLIDDAFRLGEYVDVGEVKGTVEKIQMRSLRLRHHRGAVHTIPFGEISHLTNYSRDWAIMKLKFRVPFDTDIEKVRKVLKKVGQELLNHPDVGEDFIQPFKSQGVLEVDDYGLVVRAKFMCKPGGQFLIRRHAYVAVQQAFIDNGIEFAQPEIRVVSSDDDDTNRSQQASAALATQIRSPATTPDTV